MAILSSHLLNSVTGDHAANVEITIFKFDENNQLMVFNSFINPL